MPFKLIFSHINVMVIMNIMLKTMRKLGKDKLRKRCLGKNKPLLKPHASLKEFCQNTLVVFVLCLP